MRMKPTQGKWHGLPGTHTFPSAGSGDAIYEEASSPATASGGVCLSMDEEIHILNGYQPHPLMT